MVFARELSLTNFPQNSTKFFVSSLEHLHSFWERKEICKIDWCVLCKCMISWLNPTKYKIFNIHLIQNVNIFAWDYFVNASSSGENLKSNKKNAKLDISDAEVKSLQHLHPTSMRIIEKIFSLSVLGATLPKPTEISPVKQK